MLYPNIIIFYIESTLQKPVQLSVNTKDLKVDGCQLNLLFDTWRYQSLLILFFSSVLNLI